jgi:hypothetical protein
MLALILLPLLPLALSAPHPDPNPNPFAVPPPKDTIKQGRSLPLKHSEGYIRRARDVALSKRQSRAHIPRGGAHGKIGRREVEERDSLDPTWLLREAAKVDTRYNGGAGGFGTLLAKEKGKRAGSIS